MRFGLPSQHRNRGVWFANRQTALLAAWVLALAACDKPVIREHTRPLSAGDTPGVVGGVTGDDGAGPSSTTGTSTGSVAGATTGSQEDPGGGNGGNEDPNSSAGAAPDPTNGAGGQGSGSDGLGSDPGGATGSPSHPGGERGTTSSANPNGGSVSGGTDAGGTPNVPAGDGGSAGEGTLEPTPPFTQQGLLETLADCAMQSYEEFAGVADALADACDDLAGNPSGAAERSAAQAAWRAANASWQRTEVFEFGPAAPGTTVGGQDFRDQIYAFPLANNCRVDQQIVSQLYADDDAFAASLVSGRGIAALEYLLFYDGASNSCSSGIAINAGGTWAALSLDELRQRRADYAEAAALDVATSASGLVWAWDPSGGDFRDEFVSAGAGSSVFPTRLDAFNAVTESLFYIELEVKDLKLGWPLGLVPQCTNAPGTCPNAVESRFALASTDNLAQNLESFRRAFVGCGDGALGLGFDDWLAAEGAAELAESMTSGVNRADAAVLSLSPPLEQAIVSDPDQVRGVHTAFKSFTDEMKTEFVSILGLRLPPTVAGDTD